MSGDAPTPGGIEHLPIATRAALVTTISYLTGWGFVLPLLHLLALSGDIERGRPATVDAGLLWATATTVLAQIAIALGIAPLALDSVVTSHLLAALSVALVAFVARRLVGITRTQRSERRRAEQQEERFRALVEDSADLVLVVDDDLIVRWCTPATRRLLGPSLDHATSYLDLVHEDDRGRVRGLVAAARGTREQAAPVLVRVPSGRGLLVTEARHRDLRHDPAVGGFVARLRDVTQRERERSEAEQSPPRDAATGLLGQRALTGALEAALGRQQLVGLVEVHVVGLRSMLIADGRERVDGLLREVAGELESVRRPQDTLARTGNKTFALLLPDVNADVLRELPRTAYNRVSEICGSRDSGLQVAVGVATSRDGINADEVQQSARFAAEHAIAAPTPPRVERFYAGMRLDLEHRISIERSLPVALDEQQFHLAYQPIFPAGDQRRVSGVEALLRWRHPGFGELPPAHFIPIAERSGLIVEVGHWVLVEATRQLVAWDEAAGPGSVSEVSVNLSARQLAHGDAASRVRDALERSGLDPARLLIELTESALVEDASAARIQLRELADLGVRLALDDFGTGWASLASLQHFPFHVLKIDRSFVGHGTTRRRPEMLASMISLGRSLGLSVTAEGVESLAELQEVQALGADHVQGWLLGRAQSADELLELVRGSRRSRGDSPPSPAAQ